ncbi:MAG TPA: hypothetical protein VJJ79_03460 [Candidatus Nanoarchaeia archaeon]|nr:hypothetical protein [Candidatus Nanoarchaeia archaeon]
MVILVKKDGVFMTSVALRLALVFLLLGIFSFSVSAANVTAQDGFDWLAEASDNGSYDEDVGESSFALLALNSVGSEISLVHDWLYSAFDDTSFCWPDGGCTVKETSLAVLALDALLDDTYFDSIGGWYADALQDADVSGGWFLEVVTSDSGTCTVSYELDGIVTDIPIDVEEGAFPSCDDSHFLDLDSCLKENLISSHPGITLDVDCNALEGDVVLVLVYKSSSSYYLLGNENSDTADFIVSNGCFARGETGSCDLDSTLYAQWALGEMGNDISTLIYLKEKYDDTDSEQAALLYLITKEEGYLQDLADLQKSDGSFDRDVYTTALAILALKESVNYEAEIDAATSFILEEQDADGHWNNDVSATALALYAAFSDEDVTPVTCDDAEQNGEEEGIDCGGACDACIAAEVISECDIDADCEELYDVGYVCDAGECTLETSIKCAIDDDCASDEVCLDDTCIEGNCNYQGDKDSDTADCEYPDYNENAYNCPSDCWCGDDVCDDIEADADSSSDYYCADDCGAAKAECTEDTDCDGGFVCTGGSCEEETVIVEGGSNIVVWVIVILLFIALGIGGYIAYKKGLFDAFLSKFKKGGGKGPQVSVAQVGQPYRPFTSRLQQRSPQQPQRPFGR